MKGYKVYGCKADVSTEEGRNVLLKEVELTFNNQLDCLVNSAGYYSSTDYEKQFQTNLDSAFFLTKSCYSLLKESKKGPSVVNIGSVSGTFLDI